MLKKTIILPILVLIISCGTAQKSEPVTKNNAYEPAVGWSGTDTYTVRVTAADLKQAKDRAKHKIYKDIVNVRLHNESPYTDITKIMEEFQLPMDNGKVIRETKKENGLEIFFQIYEKDLKKKFERK